MIFMAASIEKTMRKKYSSFSCGSKQSHNTLLCILNAPLSHPDSSPPRILFLRCPGLRTFASAWNSSTPIPHITTIHPHTASSLPSYRSLLKSHPSPWPFLDNKYL